MKKFFSHISVPLLSLVVIFVISGFVSNIPYTQAQTDLSDPGTTNTINDPGSTNTIGGAPIELTNPFKGGDSLFELLKSVMNDIVLPIGGVLAVLAFIYSGFLYVTARGDETQLKTAHKALLYTAIGTAVLLGSWVLANVICETIGQLGGPACAT